MLSVTENSELVRRRGRWLTPKIMEIYLQDTSAIRYILSLSNKQRSKVLTAASVFLEVLSRAELLDAASIPFSSWYFVFSKS